MPKYKKVNEGIIDNFITKIFTSVGKGLESRAIKKLSKGTLFITGFHEYR